MTLYLISDTHFDHANIIEYCNRPFSTASEMDKYMIEKWNSRVSDNDTVFFGGDVAMARPEKAFEYVEKLNGSFVTLIGNHDDFTEESAPFPVFKYHHFEYEHENNDYEFYYSHYPSKAEPEYKDSYPNYAFPPEDFEGWNIHGHVHNNNTDDYPFINHDEQRVNLSVEVLNYTPITLTELTEIIKKGNNYKTIEDIDCMNF